MGVVWSKLDTYDYLLLEGVVRIYIKGYTDPILVDILSELSQTDGNVYVEGNYYKYQDMYEIVVNDEESYMDLKVSVISYK